MEEAFYLIQGPIKTRSTSAIAMFRQSNAPVYHEAMIDFFESPFGLWIRVVIFFLLSLYLLRSGIQPDATEPRKWHDRALRISGGVIFGAGALFGSARILGWVH